MTLDTYAGLFGDDLNGISAALDRAASESAPDPLRTGPRKAGASRQGKHGLTYEYVVDLRGIEPTDLFDANADMSRKLPQAHHSGAQLRAPGRHRRRPICGWTLARAHAQSGDPVAIAEYLGGDDAFDRAITDFSERYADQNEQDFQEFVKAVRPAES